MGDVFPTTPIGLQNHLALVEDGWLSGRSPGEAAIEPWASNRGTGSLRYRPWLGVHLIEETAWHRDHLDILCELAECPTGE